MPLPQRPAPVIVETKVGNPPLDKGLKRQGLIDAGNFIKDRTLFGSDMGLGLVKKPPLTLPVFMGSSSKELIATAQIMNKTAFERLRSGFVTNFNIPKSSLDSDPSFQKDVLALRDMELSPRNRKLNKQKYINLRNRVNLRIAGYPPEAREGAARYLNSYFKLEKERNLAVQISALEKPDAEPKTLELVQKWRQEIKKLDEEYQKGGISEEEYFIKRNEINEKAVKASGDEELEELWGGYKEDEQESGKLTVQISIGIGPNEKMVDNKPQSQAAFSGVSGTNVGLDIHDDGTASVTVGPEKYPMEICVFKNGDNDQYVYYLFDHHADQGVVRVDTGDLIGALDQRYLDTYFTHKLGVAGDDNNSPSKIPDKDLISMGERILGSGKERNYMINGENKLVMDGFMEILTVNDKKYSDYYSKVRALNVFLQKDDNVALVRRVILEGKKPNVTELIGNIS